MERQELLLLYAHALSGLASNPGLHGMEPEEVADLAGEMVYYGRRAFQRELRVIACDVAEKKEAQKLF